MKEIVIIREFGAKNYKAGVFYDGNLKYEIDDRYEFPDNNSKVLQMVADLANLAKSASNTKLQTLLLLYQPVPKFLRNFKIIAIKSLNFIKNKPLKPLLKTMLIYNIFLM